MLGEHRQPAEEIHRAAVAHEGYQLLVHTVHIVVTPSREVTGEQRGQGFSVKQILGLGVLGWTWNF